MNKNFDATIEIWGILRKMHPDYAEQEQALIRSNPFEHIELVLCYYEACNKKSKDRIDLFRTKYLNSTKKSIDELHKENFDFEVMISDLKNLLKS